MSSLAVIGLSLLEELFHGVVEAPPAGGQLTVEPAAGGAQDVVATRRALARAPLADQDALCLEPAQQGIEGALLDRHAAGRQGLPQLVAVAQRAQLGQGCEDDHAAAQLQLQLLEGAVHHAPYSTVWH